MIGGNASGVTGSCTRIDFFGRTILFELGMVQDHSTILSNYKDNCAIFNRMKPKKVEMIIIGHCHCDHIGLIPMLFARGNINFKVGDNGYSSDILVGIGSDGSAVLYDLIDIREKI